MVIRSTNDATTITAVDRSAFSTQESGAQGTNGPSRPNQTSSSTGSLVIKLSRNLPGADASAGTVNPEPGTPPITPSTIGHSAISPIEPFPAAVQPEPQLRLLLQRRLVVD
jgi:hypothetical protein